MHWLSEVPAKQLYENALEAQERPLCPLCRTPALFFRDEHWFDSSNAHPSRVERLAHTWELATENDEDVPDAVPPEAERGACDAFAAYEALPPADKRAAHAAGAVGLEVARGMVAHYRSWRYASTLGAARLAEVLHGMRETDGSSVSAAPINLFALTPEEEEEDLRRTREHILALLDVHHGV